jgi:Ca2+/Na+ antiporter
MTTSCNVTVYAGNQKCCMDAGADRDVCCPGEGGMLLGKLPGESDWPGGLRGFLYGLGMLWAFMGVAIVADKFMEAIEQVTSKTYVKTDKDGTKRVVKLWNPTVANLSLMALGSSAPEIMLNVLEIVFGNFFAGALGPSTIVGSAAFNLLVIIAVCVAAITDGVRKVEQIKVYAITSTCSVLAYVWLIIILMATTPNVVTPFEAILTFAFFFILLIVSYAADKNFFRAVKVAPDSVSAQREKRGNEAAAATDEAVYRAMKQVKASKEKDMDGMDETAQVALMLEAVKPVTQATHRRNALGWLTGRKPRPVYDPKQGAIIQGGKRRASLRKALTQKIGLGGSSTKEMTPQQSKKAVAVTPTELQPASPSVQVATLGFKEQAINVLEDAGSTKLYVVRTGGETHKVTVEYSSHDITATKGVDYKDCAGTLTFNEGETEKEIEVFIIDDDKYEKAETFRVELSEPKPGGACEIDSKAGAAMITIDNDDELKSKAHELAARLANRDKLDAVFSEWKDSFIEAFKPGGEDDEPPGAVGWIMHIITVIWKVCFATVPPVALAGGWAAFVLGIAWIGLITIFVGDLAGLFGCVLGLPPAITAITFVALGTSMPDMFASKAAATSQDTADDSVGNVTGSNCVNVFLGLGLPWSIGALYWAAMGPTADFKAKFDTPAMRVAAPQAGALIDSGTAGFVVIAGALGFSVSVFCVCALLCLGTLLIRRQVFDGELGGPAGPRNATAVFFVLLWFVYIMASVLQIYGVIKI